MSQLALFLLGSPRLELDGDTLEIGRRKAVALVAYLAVTGRGHTRDALATLLWPEFDQVRARAALRRTLSTLNRAIGGAWLDADREMIDLKRGADFWLDVEEFRGRLAACRAHAHPETEACPDCLTLLAEAAALYRDDFLTGFTLRDSHEFDDWQFFQSESLRRELAVTLEHLVHGHCAQDEYEAAVRYARRWLRLDPLREEAHRQLMKLYAGTDQRPAALRQYQECVRILEEELGMPPSEETTALYESIRSGDVGKGAVARERERQAISRPLPSSLTLTPPVPPFLSSTTTPPHPHSPFVARKKELMQLRARLDAALAGEGHVAFVSGEAGGGKTALVHEFARRAQDDIADLVVAIGTCNAYTGVGDPYLPFREVLSLLTGDIEIKWAQGTITEENALRLWALLPDSLQTLIERGPNLIDSFIASSVLVRRATVLGRDRAAWANRLESLVEKHTTDDSVASLAQSDLFEQYTHVLGALARHQPLLLIVDDAQWADAASINLLFHLSRRLAGSRILLVVTYRPDEVALGRNGGRHPLEPVINELKRTYGDVWIDLDPAMGRHFVDALLDTEPNQLADGFRTALSSQTEGHPLFTVELLRAMQERGDLVRDSEGYWIEGSALDWDTLPARVEAVIEERVSRLEGGLRDVLAVASVEGETFTAQVVARVQGMSERPVLGALSQELERRHHLVQGQGEVRVDHQFLSRFRFTHTMFQQYLYNAFSPGERRLLHGAIASVLEDLFQEEGEEVTVQLARHYAEAGQVEQAVDYLLRAGDRARDLYAHQEAIGFYEQALAFLKEEGANERAARALMKLGLTHHLTFNFQRAREAYQEGFALWQRAGTDPTPLLPPAPHPLRMIWFDPTTLDPGLVQDDISVIILTQLFSGLVTLNAELDVIPELAQRWEVLEGGVRYIFHLRDDALWTDGQPVTAEDFVYAWKRALQPGGGSTAASFLYDIKGARTFHQGHVADPDQIGVRALDTVTLLVELEGPTGFFPQLLTQPALFPVPRHVVEAHGEAWTEMEHLVTNGPFKLERWQPGHSMLLTRNPHYRGQFAGNVDEVDLILNAASVADQSELYAADRLDIVQLWASPDSDRVRQRHAEEYLHGPALSTHYVGFNVTHAPFNDLRVRRALALATDKETLASVNMWGYSFPATGGFMPPEMPGHSPAIGLAYDPELARELLAEAGYPGGRKFPRTQGLVHTPNRDLVCEPLRMQWRENLGIDVEWQTDDFGSMLDRLEKDPPDLFYGAWRADYPDPDNPLRVSSHSRWTGWQNEVYVRLLEEAKRTSNQPERIKQYQEADRILVEEAAVVPLLYGRNHLLVKPWVRKFSTSAMSWFLWKDVFIEPHE